MTTPAISSSPAESRVNLLTLTPAAAHAELATFLERNREAKYRAAQIARRLWLNPAPTFGAMTELPKSLREAVFALNDDPFFRSAFGETFVDYYVHIKNAEIERFQAEVSDWEHREYFEMF